MSKKFTPRGFAIYDEFEDSYGSTIRVQESSNAEVDAVWIFTDNEDTNNPSPHLSVSEAIQLRNALNEFIEEYS